jgi:16S rRNA (uracil1498-N3)-methyltransferase
MPATPAWPPKSTPRLFVAGPLAAEQHVIIDGNQAHYLISVMRAKPGGFVKLCDDMTGEWLGEIVAVSRRALDVRLVEQLRPRETVPDLWLIAALIKKNRFDWLVEKACELGVARLQPLITDRTIVDRVNPERLRLQAIEAAEQCGRTALPDLCEPASLSALIANWPEDRIVYFADENGGEPFNPAPGPSAIMIGAEGGFTDQERAAIRAIPQAKAITLGPRILRAETAAIAAVSAWMAKAGDWTAI